MVPSMAKPQREQKRIESVACCWPHLGQYIGCQLLFFPDRRKNGRATRSNLTAVASKMILTFLNAKEFFRRKHLSENS